MLLPAGSDTASVAWANLNEAVLCACVLFATCILTDVLDMNKVTSSFSPCSSTSSSPSPSSAPRQDSSLLLLPLSAEVQKLKK